MVRVFATRGIELSCVGVGKETYNDKLMRLLADNGNGACFYADSLAEAEKVLTRNLPLHLDVLALDAKVQVEFNRDVIERFACWAMKSARSPTTISATIKSSPAPSRTALWSPRCTKSGANR